MDRRLKIETPGAQLYSLAVIALLLLIGAACQSVRSTAATALPGIRLTLTAASLPPPTQTALALHITTPYARLATASPVMPQPTRTLPLPSPSPIS